MGKNIKWTKDEDNVLLQYYVDQGPDFCFKFLNRSMRGIKHRAQMLNLYMNNKTKGKKNRKYTKEVLELVVKNSINYADVLRNLGVKAQAANYTNIKKRILEYDLDVSHFKSSSELTSMRNKTRSSFFVKNPTEKYLVENSTIDNQNLKKRLYNENFKQPICEMCGQGETWHGKQMSLILDHINGVNNDNRLKNLRIVCPNCNATLDTHCSKNRKIKNRFIQKKDVKPINAKEKRKKTPEQNKKYRKPTIKKPRPRKVELPSLDLLQEMIKRYSYVEVGRRFGVSDNAVRKWFKCHGVQPPKTRGVNIDR